MIHYDKTDICYTAIDTLAWLDKTAGPVCTDWHEWLHKLDDEHKATFGNESDWNWAGANPYTGRYWIAEDEMQRAIAEYLLKTTGEPWVAAHDVENVYNGEQDFSRVFQFQVWVPMREATYHEKTKEWYCDEWYYKDEVYVATEIHQGGDVRANYSTVQLRKPDYYCHGDLVDSGFLDWTIGWYVMAYSAKEKGDTNFDEDGEFGQGYHGNPTYHLESELTGKAMWSERHNCFVGWLNGRAVKMYGECRAQY